MDFREMPALMKEQMETGKKDKYIEITNVLLEAGKTLSGKEEKFAYIKAVIGTLEHMDFQIYELYRALADAFRVVLKEVLADYETLAVEEKEAISQAIKSACAMRILLEEKYEAYIL